jgi:hypothetical protein
VSGKRNEKFPYRFDKNGRTGKIYRAANGTFSTYFSLAGEKKRNTFKTFEAAKNYLSGEFETLDENRAESKAVYPLKHDRMYYHDLEAYLHAHTDGANLRDAVDFYVSQKPKSKFKPLTVTRCKEKFLADKQNEGLSYLQMRSLRKHLKRFEATFGSRQIHDITSEEIKNWLHTQKGGKPKKAWSNKYKANVLGTLVTFARVAKLEYKAFPNPAMLTDFELVKKPKPEERGEVEIYTAEQLAEHLNTAVEHDMEVLPLIVIEAFFGLRPTEVHGEEVKRPKLRWDAFNWERKFLHLRHQKVRSKLPRDIPIHPTAEKWLTPFRKLTGAIWKRKAAYDERMVKLHEKIGKPRVHNAYRHSYTSYRLIHLGHKYAALAVELGNSEREIIKSYRRNVTAEDADAWFAVEPPEGYAEKVAAYIALTTKKDSCPPTSAQTDPDPSS